jgi:prepilin-type processing-associated H-X9-DG protein
MQYTFEHNGRFPFGMIFNRQNPNTGRPSDGGASGYITWFSSFDKYLTSGTNEIILLNFNTGFFDGATRRRFDAAFKCPAIPANFQQQVQYYQHGVVMPHMTLEIGFPPGAGSTKLRTPAKVNQVYPDTALLWDTPVYGAAAPETPALFWATGFPITITGFAPFPTFIDDDLLCNPQYPERRFRGPGADRFAGSTNVLKHPSGPIAFPSDEYVNAVAGPEFTTANGDGVNGVLFPGNARFRHTGLGCNVLFADGTVRSLFLYPRRIVAGTVGDNEGQKASYIDSDFRRHMLMTKWPSGIVDSLAYPTN